ncbi:hypothetical protein [Kitasatospora sp. NPDC088351]|uniref:hypothetical protein n=1 Tax=unclassified Kitasatospora TaxID=2633591 RepID=UPI00344A805F
MSDTGRFSEAGEQRPPAVAEAAAAVSVCGPPVERPADHEEFDRLVRRVAESTHQLIDAVSARVLGRTTGEAADQSRRLAANAHDVLGLLLDLSTLAPAFADREGQSAVGPQRTPAAGRDGRPER